MTRRLTLALLLVAAPAFAHHPLNGLPMATFADGVLSGLGHPVLGFDHLFFVIAVGTAAALMGRIRTAPLAYIATMLAGVLLVHGGITFGGVELAVTLSLLCLGGWIAARATDNAAIGMGLFGAFGLFHGMAFGGAIAGVEGQAATPVLAGYLIGLAVLQYAVAVLVGWGTARRASSQTSRLIGAGVAGAGVFLLLDSLEGPLVQALIG